MFMKFGEICRSAVMFQYQDQLTSQLIMQLRENVQHFRFLPEIQEVGMQKILQKKTFQILNQN